MSEPCPPGRAIVIVGVAASLFYAVCVQAGGDELFAILRFFRFPV